MVEVIYVHPTVPPEEGLQHIHHSHLDHLDALSGIQQLLHHVLPLGVPGQHLQVRLAVHKCLMVSTELRAVDASVDREEDRA